MINSPDVSSSRNKGATLKPLDLTYFLRCPTTYLKTRVYADLLADEIIDLLTESFAAQSKSIAFPELSLPAIVSLKKLGKQSGSSTRLKSQVKLLVEKLERNSSWIEERREKIEFAPRERSKVDRFLIGESDESTPLGAYARLTRRVREQKRVTLEKAVSRLFFFF